MYTYIIMTLEVIKFFAIGKRVSEKKWLVKSGRRAVRTDASTITGSVDLVWRMCLERLRNITNLRTQVSRKTRPVVT